MLLWINLGLKFFNWFNKKFFKIQQFKKITIINLMLTIVDTPDIDDHYDIKKIKREIYQLSEINAVWYICRSNDTKQDNPISDHDLNQSIIRLII